MQKVCKRVNILSHDFIEMAVLECLKPAKKRKRSDTRRLFRDVLGVGGSKVRRILLERDESYYLGVKYISIVLYAKIENRNLNLRPVYQQERTDPGSRKKRTISILSIEQLMLDHVAVLGLQELSKRIGEYQVSSIPKRGAHYGKRAIQRWLRDKKCKYAVKLDIKDFYGSLNRDILFKWLRKRVKNDILLWLVEELVCQTESGMAIGSFLSQTLANIFLSELYHHAMERCVSSRGTRQIGHALFYMDDMLFLGANKRQLKDAVYKVIRKAQELGLEIKSNWNVFLVTNDRPIDMMGFRFSHSRVTLRKRVFKAVRRTLLRAARILKKDKRLSIRLCARLASYYGYIVAVACRYFLQRSNAMYTFQKAFTRISYDQSTLLRKA